MAKRAEDFDGETSIAVANPEVDTSVEALAKWIAELEREDDWIDLPATAADLIAEDRYSRGS